MKKTLALLSALLISASSYAQKPLIGKIDYEIKYENVPQEYAMYMQNSEMTMYISKEKSRSDMNMGFGQITTVSDLNAKSAMVMSNMMGNKFVYKITDDESKRMSGNTPDPVIKYIDETKEIAGYKCKKAEITTENKDGEEMVTTVFYSEELVPPTSRYGRTDFKGLKGLLMESSTAMDNGITMIMRVKKVDLTEQNASVFNPSTEGYQEKTLEEVMNSRGGGNWGR